ncbi:hypothetical protein KJ359_007864 [Pestalotiopsis sp. 9143b]|nr:hypothetical protein KJ359_007864 [Pestalotiopsis sp. 9143b]
MKPVVGSMQAWSCVVISAFAILILSVIGSLFRSGHHEFLGSTEDPDPKVGGEVASTVFVAVLVYVVRCSFYPQRPPSFIATAFRGVVEKHGRSSTKPGE